MFKKNIITFILILFVALKLTSTSSAQKLRWKNLQTDLFNVYYFEKDLPHATNIITTLTKEYPRVAEGLGFELTAPINIFLCKSESIYKYIVGQNFPDWSSGAALPSHQVMVLKTYNPRSNIRRTAVHELVHLIIDQAISSKPIPRWLNEGLAVYFSGEEKFASTSLISKALMTESLIDFIEIDYVLSFNISKAQLAYQESYLAVKLLIKRYGRESISALISAFATEDDANKAFIKALGIDVLDFEIEWFRYVRKKYRWHFLIEIETYLWMLMPLLFIFIIFVVRRRNRETLKRWESEEESYYEDET